MLTIDNWEGMQKNNLGARKVRQFIIYNMLKWTVNHQKPFNTTTREKRNTHSINTPSSTRCRHSLSFPVTIAASSNSVLC